MIRPYRSTDYSVLKQMLGDRGFQERGMGFGPHPTYVLDINGIVGFITIQDEEGVPYLRHFCVDKKCSRADSVRFMWRLLKCVRDKTKKFASQNMYIAAPSNDIYLNKLILRFYTCRLLHTIHGDTNMCNNVYLAEVK